MLRCYMLHDAKILITIRPDNDWNFLLIESLLFVYLIGSG